MNRSYQVGNANLKCELQLPAHTQFINAWRVAESAAITGLQEYLLNQL